MEDGGWKLDVGGLRFKDGGLRMEVGCWKIGDKG